MKAYYVEADWAPKQGYALSPGNRRPNALLAAILFGKIYAAVYGIDRSPLFIQMRCCCKLVQLVSVELMCLDEEGYTKYNGHSKYPIITGHVFAGEIVECGNMVKNLKGGDLVSIEYMNWCGECILAGWVNLNSVKTCKN